MITIICQRNVFGTVQYTIYIRKKCFLIFDFRENIPEICTIACKNNVPPHFKMCRDNWRNLHKRQTAQIMAQKAPVVTSGKNGTSNKKIKCSGTNGIECCTNGIK